MAGIFEEVRMRENAYANNPQALQQRYAQTQELVDLLSLQRVSNLQQAAKNQITAAMQTKPGTRVEQLEQEVLSGARSEVLAELAPGIQQKGQRSMQRQAMMGQQPMRQPMQGVAGMPANNMMKAAQGGIVGYAEGGATQDSNSEEAQRQRYLQLKAAEAQAIQTDNQLALQNIRRELRNYEGSTAAQAPAPTPENTDGMAGGGIVGFDGTNGSQVKMTGIGKAYIDPETGEAIPVMDRFKMGLAGLVDLFRSDASNDARRFNMDMVEAVADRDLDAIQFGRTSDDARDFNMDVIEALTERNIGGEEEIEEETMETMSVPTRAEAFASMFPNAQQGVDDYARDKELGGIGSLRTAGRMQEQRRDRNQAMQDFFGDLASQQAQARQDKARMAAQFMLNEDKFNKRTYELDPAMTLEGIEEVGIEGFDRGGIVSFATGDPVVDPDEAARRKTLDEYGIDPDFDTNPLSLFGRGFKNAVVGGIKGLTAIMPNGGSEGERRLAQQAYSESMRQAYPNASDSEIKAMTVVGMAEGRESPAPASATSSAKFGPPTRAEEFARMFPDARKGVEEFAEKKRLTALQDEQTERDNIAGTKRLRNIATFLRGMGSGSSTAESLQKGGDALEAAIVADEKQQAALLNAQLDRMGKMAVAQLAAKVDREKILADFEGRITAAEMDIAQKTLEDLQNNFRFQAAAEKIRDQDLDPLEEQVRIQNLTVQLVSDSVASARAGIYQNSDVNNPLDLGLE